MDRSCPQVGHLMIRLPALCMGVLVSWDSSYLNIITILFQNFCSFMISCVLIMKDLKSSVSLDDSILGGYVLVELPWILFRDSPDFKIKIGWTHKLRIGSVIYYSIVSETKVYKPLLSHAVAYYFLWGLMCCFKVKAVSAIHC